MIEMTEEEQKTFDMAKLALMQKFQMSEAEAHRWIIDTAMNVRKSKVTIAVQILDHLGVK